MPTAEEYTEHVNAMLERAGRRIAAQRRLERFGCCGEHDQRLRIDVIDKDGRGNVLRRWSVTKCLLAKRVCRLAEVEELADIWGRINATD